MREIQNNQMKKKKKKKSATNGHIKVGKCGIPSYEWTCITLRVPTHIEYIIWVVWLKLGGWVAASVPVQWNQCYARLSNFSSTWCYLSVSELPCWLACEAELISANFNHTVFVLRTIERSELSRWVSPLGFAPKSSHQHINMKSEYRAGSTDFPTLFACASSLSLSSYLFFLACFGEKTHSTCMFCITLLFFWLYQFW